MRILQRLALKYGPLKFSFRRVRLQLTKEVGRNNRYKDFLSDVLVAVASLDLKVPISLLSLLIVDISKGAFPMIRSTTP